jgi:hypothetical protein
LRLVDPGPRGVVKATQLREEASMTKLRVLLVVSLMAVSSLAFGQDTV